MNKPDEYHSSTEDEDDEDYGKMEAITIGGKSYWIDKEDNVYDKVTHARIGEYNARHVRSCEARSPRRRPSRPTRTAASAGRKTIRT